jgi:hypothetical protein
MLNSPKEIFESLEPSQQSSLTRELSQADQTAFDAWMTALEDPATIKATGVMVKFDNQTPCFCAQGAGLAVFYPDTIRQYFARHGNANALLLGLKVAGIEQLDMYTTEFTISEKRSNAFYWTIVHLNDGEPLHLNLPLPAIAGVLKHARALPYDPGGDTWPS